MSASPRATATELAMQAIAQDIAKQYEVLLGKHRGAMMPTVCTDAEWLAACQVLVHPYYADARIRARPSAYANLRRAIDALLD